MNDNKEKTVSVAMAVYNGETYLREQVDSILPQLKAGDEFVVSLDPSTDRSGEILAAYARLDSRIRLINGPGKGVIRNFEAAVQACGNQIIFLADQDDVWQEKKVETVLRAFDMPGVLLVMHDAALVDGALQPLGRTFFDTRGCKTGLLRNLWRNTYIGCCMAFRAELKSRILPFPQALPMHDQWIGLMGDRLHGNRLIPQRLIYYRRHGGNVTQEGHAGLSKMLQWRIQICWAVLRSLFKKHGN